MIIIAGLGNPEKDYRNTRHNIGFETLNKFSYDHNIPFTKAKFRAHVGEGRFGGRKIILMKPQTYMNSSGEAIRDMLNFHGLPPDNLIVIYDDTALDVGDIRIRKQGSAGGHNGMKNIIYHLDTDIFPRIRVGIGEKPPGYDLADYVLSRFRPNEIEDMVTGVSKATDALEMMLNESVDAAMNRFNKKKAQEIHDEMPKEIQKKPEESHE